MRALPESRMILLVQDPRDVAASALAVSFVPKGRRDRTSRVKRAEERPEDFVRLRARAYAQDIELTKQAYNAHEERKVLVRYEYLRADTLETMKHSTPLWRCP